MKKFALILGLLLGAWCASAQGSDNQTDSQGRKHGLWRKYYNAKQLRYEGRFEHGKEVGTFVFYFPSGDLQARNTFRVPGKVAYSRQYGGEGQLAAEGKYVDAKRDSVWTFYDIEGNVLSRESFRAGQRHGESVTYFDNGKVAEIVTYENGVESGPWKQFFDTGKLRTKGNYKNGMRQGEVSFFYANGKPRIKGSYHKGKMHGNWYYFSEFFEIEKKQVWRYGSMISSDPEEEEKVLEEEIEPSGNKSWLDDN